MEQLVIRVNESAPETDYSFQDWLTRGQSWWKTRAGRAIEADQLVVIDAAHQVVAVGKICGVKKDIEGGTGRIAIDVIPAPQSELLGKTIERGNSRNPVAYMQQITVLA